MESAMSFAFDTGAPLPISTELANGVIALLEPLVYTSGAPATTRGPYLRTLRQLPFDLDEKVFEENWQDALGQLPSAIVVIGDAEQISNRGTSIKWRFDIRVHCCSGAPGSWVNGRINAIAGQDTRWDPGVAVITQHVLESLHSRTPSTPATAARIQVTRMTHGLTGPALSWWTVHGRVEVVHSVELERNVALLDAITAKQGVDSKGSIVGTEKTYP
jgi:hypothetical protein